MKKTISELKTLLTTIDDRNDPVLQELRKDDRKGVAKAIKQWENALDKHQKLIEEYKEMSEYEQQAFAKGFQYIAGIDEVGRGPLAGPVTAAAVILDPKKPIIGLNDSKKLSFIKRNALYDEIKEKAISIGVGSVDAGTIDKINIYQASKAAMEEAVANLTIKADYLLIDAMRLSKSLPQESIIKGDAKSVSIAAASIIAKVERDRLMDQYNKIYPGYGFDKNAGYGTKEHLNGLDNLGITPIHRLSFAPVRERK